MKAKQIFLLTIVLLVNVKGKTWRDFPKYYESMGYASIINALYYYLCKRHLLWEFPPTGFNWRVLRGVHIFVIVPLLVLAFLSKFPKTFWKRLIYLVKWTVTCSIVEYIGLKNNMITFKHGWTIFWSGFIYVTMYGFSYLYTQKPIYTWIISVFTTIFFILKFKIPMTKRLLKGPIVFLFGKNKPWWPFEYNF